MKPLPLAAVCSFLIGLGVGIGYFGKSGPVQAEYAARVDTLVLRERVLDTVYRREKVRMDVATTAYDTVRVTDTLVRNDTVFVPRAVADEAVNACRAVVATCEEQKAVLLEHIRIADSTIAAVPPPVNVKKLVVTTAAGTSLLILLLKALATRKVMFASPCASPCASRK